MTKGLSREREREIVFLSETEIGVDKGKNLKPVHSLSILSSLYISLDRCVSDKREDMERERERGGKRRRANKSHTSPRERQRKVNCQMTVPNNKIIPPKNVNKDRL